MTYLLQRPHTILLDDLDGSVLVQRSPPGLENGSCGNSVLQCRQRARIKLVKRNLAFVEQVDSIDELLERDVAIANLPSEVALLIRSILHVETVKELALSSKPLCDFLVLTDCTKANQSHHQ
jgi:hypothetical protein